jgi:hypothetical protein
MNTENKTVISPVKETETHEPLAVESKQDMKKGKAKLFSVAEMWNLQKKFRSASDNMRRNWN